jgi:hypothetical protein
MQIGSAYRGGSDPYDHIVRMLDAGLFNLFDRNAERPFVNDGLHGCHLRSVTHVCDVHAPARILRVTHLS